MNDQSYTIRKMNQQEVNIAIDWAASEGWNPGLHDAECYFTADPNGFFMGLIKEKPIATISAVKYGKSFGFLGYYIVKPEYRKKGYGIQIWNSALQYLEGRNIGLDGVAEQQHNYKKSGFKSAYSNIRYQGNFLDATAANSKITELYRLPFETVISYDQTLFPENRSEFINSWINQSDSFSLGITENNKLLGYGVIRKCNTGYKIGPLFADTPKLAETIFLSLTSKVKPGETIFLDVPQTNEWAVDLAERYGMKPAFETARMYTKEIPDIPINRIFGVTSFEIG